MSSENDTHIEDVTTNAVATLRAGIALGKPRKQEGCKAYALVPAGAKLEYLEKEPERPDRIKRNPQFDESDSLIAYFNRFKDGDSTLMSDLDQSVVRAVLDHSQPTAGARYHDHTAMFTAKHSPEWKVWIGSNGKKVDQVAFAQFIEDNAPDIQKPSAGELYEMALKFEAVKSGAFKSAIRLDNGSTNIGYQDDTVGSAGGGTIAIPKEIELFIPVYQGASPERVVARFRYRLNGGELTLWYDLLRIENLKRAAFKAIVDKIEADTSTKVLAGRFQ